MTCAASTAWASAISTATAPTISSSSTPPAGSIRDAACQARTRTRSTRYNGKTGAFMWRIDLGWNINHGIWFSPMVVRDLDGDSKAEVVPADRALRGHARADARSDRHAFVLDGPEYLGVYDGETGKEIDKVDWIERGQVTDWADRSGNRSSRHMLGVAYLDGKTPSVLVVRGTYGLMKVDAWMLRNRKLEKIWRWTNERAPFKYHGQGQHSIKVGRHRRRRRGRDSQRLDRDRQRRPHPVGHRPRPRRSVLPLGHRSRATRSGSLVHDRGSASAERRQPVGRAHRHADLRNEGADQGQPGRQRTRRRHRSGVSRDGGVGRQVLLHGERRSHSGPGPAAGRAGVVGRRPAARNPQPRHDREVEGRDARRHRRVGSARRRHPGRLARGDRHVLSTASCGSTAPRSLPPIAASA